MEERDVGRLAAFTDGVIVVAMTLLVLDIRLPRSAAGLDDAALLNLLQEIVPKYFGYVLSFLVIGMFWMGHVRKFRRFTRIDGGTVWLTLLFLLTIGVIPFTTSLLSENAGTLSTTIYAATMSVSSFLLVMLDWHAARKGLLDTSVSATEQRRNQFRSLLTFAVFVLSIGVAQFNPNYAKLLWLLLIPVSLSMQRVWLHKDKHRASAPTPRTPPEDSLPPR